MADETPQQRLHRAYRESRGQVYLFNLGVWLRQNHGLDRWLKSGEDLLALDDEQALAALEALPDFTEQPFHVPKSLVLASLRRAKA